jgi:pimeloyl-ACP methyl ester carboxylesterase
MPDLPGLGVTRFAARGSTRLTYEDVGDPAAPAVVALHDLLADRAVWRPLAEALVPAGWRVIAIDARGHGASAALGVRPYPPTELAGDVLAVLDEATAGPIHLVGQGWGAATALTVARFEPARIASLALLQPDLPGLLAADADPAVRWAARAAAEALGVAAQAAGTGQTDRALAALLDPRWGAGWRERLPKPRLAAIKRYGGSLGALLAGAEGHEPDPAALSALKMPALVLRHRDAGDLDVRVADRLAAALPAARLEVIAGDAALGGQLDPAAAATIAAFVGFLRGLSPQPTG